MAACNDHIGFPGLVHKGLPKDAGLFDFSPHAYNPQMLKPRTKSIDCYYQMASSLLLSILKYIPLLY